MVKTIVGVMGSSPFALSANLSTTAQLRAYLDVCAKYDVRTLDTARLYGQGESERMLGQLDASNEFVIDTKIASAMPTTGTLQREKVEKSVKESLEALQVDQVDVLYIHQPDEQTPLGETLQAVNEAYSKGAFKRFGICHYPAEKVQEIYDICNANKYVLPSVYQGGFNAISRSSENALLPTLRKLDISFVGFGGTAGGLLAKSLTEIQSPKEGTRWASLPLMQKLYGSDVYMDQVGMLHSVCEREDIAIGEASLRWIKHHSALKEQDAVLLGASSPEQLEQNLKALTKGPLPASLAEAYEQAWSAIQKATV